VAVGVAELMLGLVSICKLPAVITSTVGGSASLAIAAASSKYIVWGGRPDDIKTGKPAASPPPTDILGNTSRPFEDNVLIRLATSTLATQYNAA
jgi:hypothetical protein